MQIHLDPEGWGDGVVSDVAKVLESTAANFLQPFRDVRPLKIFVEHRDGFPEVRPLDAPGQYLVFLSADERYYSQYAYQFSHELCHVLQRCEKLQQPGNAWFHESLCEMASLFTIRALSKSWVSSPPYSHWRSYASSLGAYAQAILDREHCRLPAGKELTEWFLENESSLRGDQYIRELNRLVAVRLLPHVEACPSTWNSIQFIPDSDEPFADFLGTWRNVCPLPFHGFIDAVIHEFFP